MSSAFARRAAAMLLAAATFSSFANFSGGNADSLAPVRELIVAKRFDEALNLLRDAEDTGSADWHNLMGYALRRSPAPDLAAAQKHYDAALRIDPLHRGALAYSGELRLIRGDLKGAEQRLARLAKACNRQCTEYLDLEDAVKRYKVKGRHVGW